jgi:hypothetical protein
MKRIQRVGDECPVDAIHVATEHVKALGWGMIHSAMSIDTWHRKQQFIPSLFSYYIKTLSFAHCLVETVQNNN